jgi:hypothetical protein
LSASVIVSELEYLVLSYEIIPTKILYWVHYTKIQA